MGDLLLKTPRLLLPTAYFVAMLAWSGDFSAAFAFPPLFTFDRSLYDAAAALDFRGEPKAAIELADAIIATEPKRETRRALRAAYLKALATLSIDEDAGVALLRAWIESATHAKFSDWTVPMARGYLAAVALRHGRRDEAGSLLAAIRDAAGTATTLKSQTSEWLTRLDRGDVPALPFFCGPIRKASEVPRDAL